MTENSQAHTNGRRPLVLVCNDDGIQAPGLLALASALDTLGRVVVVAPLTEQSAVGHAITTRNPVRAEPWPYRLPSGPIPAYSVTGTPADCVKLAIDQLIPETPTVVVSGINQGPNAAVNVIYSGTVSAATEAAILGIPAIAVSYCRWSGGSFEASAAIARRIVRTVLERGLPPGILLNVNVPDLPLSRLGGPVITRQARSRWEESFSQRLDPFNRPYYWMAGRFVNMDAGENTDLKAIEEGLVSITPIQHDLTAHALINDMEHWEWERLPGAPMSTETEKRSS